MALKDFHRELVELMKRHDLTQAETAAIIARESGEPTSDRTLHRWIAPRGSADARRCPGWTVALLKAGLKTRGRAASR